MPTTIKKTTKKQTAAAKKIARIKAEIARRNKIFKAATPAEKRVLIAKDVIAQIKLKRYKATVGTWVLPKIGFPDEAAAANHPFADKDASLRELVLADKLGTCDCCALGAMFMSCTLYNNKTTVAAFDDELWEFDDIIDSKTGHFSNGLDRFFSKDQLMKIEAAFEGNIGAFVLESANRIKAGAWYDRYKNPETRLIAIMKNIIENDGKFVL